MTCFVYKAKDGFRWHVKSGNGRIVADSGEAYARLYDAKKAFDNLTKEIFLGNVDIKVEPQRKRLSRGSRL